MTKPMTAPAASQAPVTTSVLFAFDKDGKAQVESSYAYTEPKDAKEFKSGKAVLREGHYAMVEHGQTPKGAVVREVKSFEAFQNLNTLTKGNANPSANNTAAAKKNLAQMEKTPLVTYHDGKTSETMYLRKPTTAAMGQKLQDLGCVLVKFQDGSGTHHGKPRIAHGFVTPREFQAMTDREPNKYSVVAPGKATKEVVDMMLTTTNLKNMTVKSA